MICPHPIHNDEALAGLCPMCGSDAKWAFAGYDFSHVKTVHLPDPPPRAKKPKTEHGAFYYLSRYPKATCPDCDWSFKGSREEVKQALDGHLIFTHVDGGFITHGGFCRGCNAVRRQGGVRKPPANALKYMRRIRALAGALSLDEIEQMEALDIPLTWVTG